MTEATSMEFVLPMSVDVAGPSAPVESARLDRTVLENGRLQAILDALPDARYRTALVLGAGPGAARRLANRCDSVEPLSATATAGRWLGETDGFNLVVVCDLLVGADEAEMEFLIERLVSALTPGAHLVLAHWLDERGADEAAAAFVQLIGDRLAPVSRQRTPHYRLDVLEYI